MVEQQPEQISAGRSALRMVGGIFVGLIAGVVIPIAVFSKVMPALASVAPTAGVWVATILNLVLLFVVGYVAYRNMHESAGARGILIGFSIAFLLNAICGVEILRAG